MDAPHIRFIKPEETHELRQLVLRPFQHVDEMEWPGDLADGSFHLALGHGQDHWAIATFLPERNELLRGWKQYRLRGMAVHHEQQGKGWGTRLLRFGLDHLEGLKVDLLWCNARERALSFYTKAGFEVQGVPFNIEGIGNHHLMYLRL